VPPSAYAAELLAIVSAFSDRSDTEQYPAALAMARRSQFEGRLMALLNPKTKHEGLSALQLSVALLVMAAVTAPLAAMSARAADYRQALLGMPQETEAQQPAEAAQAAKPSEPAPAAKPGEAGAKPSDGASPVAAASQGQPGQVYVSGTAQPAYVQSGAGGGSYVYTTGGAPTVIPAASGGGYSYTTSAAGAAQTVAPAAASGRASSASSTNSEYGSKQLRLAELPDSARKAVQPDLLTGCIRDKSSSSSNMTEEDGTYRRVTVSYRGPDCSLEMRAEGKFTYKPDFSGIETISPGGFVKVAADIHDQITKLEMRPGSGGLEYKFSRNGQEQPFANGGPEFLAKFMISLDRMSGAGMDVRFPQMLRKGGPDRVLAEVEVIPSDYVRASYLRRLAESADLNAAQLRNTLLVDRMLSSDYEKARVLMAIAKKYDLKDAGVREAFLGVTQAMSSDYEHARSLLAFFEKGGATPEQAHAVLTSVTRMSSDYERGRVLMKLAELHKFNDDDRLLFVKAASAMSSDYEKGRTLRAAIRSQGSDDQTALAIIQAGRGMSSDYEKAQLLRFLAETRALEGQLREAYLEAARTMSSDYERNRALAAIGAGPKSKTMM
jgi:hypothetical protein